MGEAQLASDLLVSLVSGVQTIKNIERVYKEYENDESVPPNVVSAVNLYKSTMRLIGAIYPSEIIKSTNWCRPHWFYTLFTCVAHSQDALIGLDSAKRPSLNSGRILHWKSSLDELSALYDRYTEESTGDVPAAFARFINYAQRRTTDTEARRERAKYVLAAVDI